MASFNVVALISGGKDSIFSILHCQANGHKIVALANLHPPDEKKGMVEDMDSYMYQTIGHAVIPLYEQALGLPLFRQPIAGTAANRNKSYGLGQTSSDQSKDETEDLLSLLMKVISAHPEVNAVSTGAIMSDYQRTRIESVALRLGLTPLAYLWQWPSLPPRSQSSLLEDMATVGQDSRIIKVASGGLDEAFLWQNVADRRTIHRLTKAAERFGAPGDGAVLGEGGEYETLAVSGPAPLWKGRISVSEENVETLPGDAGSASLRIHGPSVSFDMVNGKASDLRIPPLLDARFSNILDSLSEEGCNHAITFPAHSPLISEVGTGVLHLGDDVLTLDLQGEGNTAQEQTRSIMSRMTAQLIDCGHGPDDIAYAVITLRDMADFGDVNAVYGSYFANPNPPARVTIACADVLPQDCRLSIAITSTKVPRDGLHVQSQSYWAPANIGPYSQAIRFPSDSPAETMRDLVYIAGQIPLIPASMTLPRVSNMSIEDEFTHQAVLAIQHLDRIGSVMKVRQWVYGIVFIATQSDSDGSLPTNARLARLIWNAVHAPQSSPEHISDGEAFDVWHLRHGTGSAAWLPQSSDEDASGHPTNTDTPPLVVIQVDKLPRCSAIEWVGFGKTTQDRSPLNLTHLQSILRRFRDRIVME